MTSTPPLVNAGPPGDVDARVSERLRVLIARRMIDQRTLSKACGVPESSLSRRLRGIGGPWRLEDLHRIAQSLGTTVSDLVADTDVLNG